MLQFTAQEKRILDMLADGRPHTMDELMGCLWDELTAKSSLIMAVCKIRAKLKPYHQYIHCIEARNGTPAMYIHVVAKPNGRAVTRTDTRTSARTSSRN
jgi:hypothetical protein